ncbi:MAG: helix-hairpin-helix domain-containing protein [Bacteroidales bacterium]|nr:helix-hairpin-helix domain-containing protein [Bacteroidales bacterium]
MHQGFKHWVKSFLTLSKFEQRGIVVLLVLLVFVTGLNFLLPSFIHNKEYSNTQFIAEVAHFKAARQNLKDSLELIKLQNKKQLSPNQAKTRIHPFSFDPNHLTYEQGIKLGLTSKQIQTIQNYLQKGGKFRKKEDFRKMYCLSATEYEILSPYIDIPEVHESASERSTEIALKPKSLEINSCDSVQLCNNLRLEGWLAARIIKYRALLGNFYSVKQLEEVYGMRGRVYQKLEGYISCDTSLVKKIDLNHASFKMLVHHPYINYETTKNLVNSRRELKGFRYIAEIRNVPGITDSVYQKLRHYLYVTPLEN